MILFCDTRQKKQMNLKDYEISEMKKQLDRDQFNKS